MHPFALPLLLLALGLGSLKSDATPHKPPAPPPPPPNNSKRPKPGSGSHGAAAAPQQQRAAAPAPKKPAPSPLPEHEQAAQQAAVDAVARQVVKEITEPSKAQAQAAPTPRLTIDVPRRNARDAAEYLKEFLQRTHAYGSKKKPVTEVKDAQRDMGQLAVDGIVGPKTRARAAQLGAKLP